MKVTLFSILFLLLTASLYAESEVWMRTQQSQQAIYEKNHPIDPITPCAGPKVEGGMDLNLSADFLYWTARLDGLSYAKSGASGDLTSNQLTAGKSKEVNWEWDAGFRAALGWNFCYGCWDMVLRYTWFYTNVDDSTSSPSLYPSIRLIPNQLLESTIFTVSGAHAHLDLHYQVGDWELGRNFYLSKTLKARPFIGLKGTWQKQDYNIFYDGAGTLGGQAFLNYKAHFDSSIYGIGMRIGVNGSWQFSKCFSLYGDVALNAMWLHYNTGRKDQFTLSTNGNPGAELTPFYVEDNLHVVKPVCEFALGLRLESYFSCKRYHLLLQVGWESQIWINQTLYMTLDHGYDRYDLSLQGLSARLRFDF